MDLNLATALGQVKLAMLDSAEKASRRRLAVYSDKITCKPACDGCCSRLVHITVAEAVIIHENLVKRELWAGVRSRAMALATTVKSTNQLSWFKMNLKCPVLDPEKKLCLAYGVRPTPCSTHFATSDPAQCDPWTTKGGDFLPLDFDEIHEDCVKRIESKLDGHGVLAYRLAIPLALLLAERIKHHRGLSIQEIMSLVYNELG